MIVVAGIIEDGDGRILLALRPEGKHLAGHWEFPGGKVESGESPDQALIRELDEELGLKIHLKRRLGSYDYVYGPQKLILHVYIVQALNSPRIGQDVPEFRFINAEDAASFRLAPADVKPWQDYLASRT
jgi:8-oxo-dGTP diphosphatase